MTLEPAEMLGLGERLGSLEQGKDANLVFFERRSLRADHAHRRR